MYGYNSWTMTDSIIYSLARNVRAKLCKETSCKEPDLRRTIGHANMLDSLIAELVNLGYDWDDDTHTEEFPITVANNPFTPSGRVQLADQVICETKVESLEYCDFDTSDDSNDSEDSDDSDDFDYLNDSDDSDPSDDSDNTSIGSFEGWRNSTTSRHDCIYKKVAEMGRIDSPDIDVQATVEEIEDVGWASP
jgi:hypothetical protein